ncbi:hypothetical protein TSUD_58430 [Trifolium subterraneum]|uniref:Zinc-finger domain-containing protein n=1 Tax=Trifolium subterraneum TaxID=3900 RepID=A0A2Z6MJM2_TRISU|nr:hypothetical protein TSUD_58430 [Trifolium subterraneum]
MGFRFPAIIRMASFNANRTVSLLKLNKYSLVLATVTANLNNRHFLLPYYKYGENVREADFNPNWTCHCCRDICNCNSCRRKNGWMLTGNIYNKVAKLGFKFVPPYLIKTCHSEESTEGSGAENIVAQEIPETTPDTIQKGPIRMRRALRS